MPFCSVTDDRCRCCITQLLEQYAEQVPWQSEIRHEAIKFPPMDKMIVDYQVRALNDPEFWYFLLCSTLTRKQFKVVNSQL